MSYKIVTSDGKFVPGIIADLPKAYDKKTQYQIAHPNIKFQVIPANDIWDSQTNQWISPDHKKKSKKRNLYYA